MKQKTRLPSGMSQKRIKGIISYYDLQSDVEGAHEIETAPDDTETLIYVPKDLLP